jgi:UDP-glucose 4-epimerase
MKYVVTGGAGFIGSHIAEALAGSHEVVIVDNFSSGKPEHLRGFEDKVSLFRGSISDLPFLKEAFQGADGIFHQAAIASVTQSIADPFTVHETNSTGTLNVLLAARDCNVPKVVFASTSAVYGDEPTFPKREEMLPHPLSPYAVSKLTGEYYGKVFSELFGVKTVSLRYFNVYGTRQDPNSDYAAVVPKFITRLLDNRAPIIYGDGKQTRDFIYVEDVVQANILAMERSRAGIFNIGSGQRIDLNELADTLATVMHLRLDPLYEKARSGDIRDSVAEISHARRAFGFVPRFTLAAGLEDTVEGFRHRQKQQTGTIFQNIKKDVIV